MVTKNTKSVNSAKHQRMMLENVLPAIQRKWPLSDKKGGIFIQEDNARPHDQHTCDLLATTAQADGWNIVVKPSLLIALT